MQIKTTMRYHLTPVIMTINKTLQIINAGGSMEKREPSYTAGGYKLVQNYGKQYGVSLDNEK